MRAHFQAACSCAMQVGGTCCVSADREFGWCCGGLQGCGKTQGECHSPLVLRRQVIASSAVPMKHDDSSGRARREPALSPSGRFSTTPDNVDFSKTGLPFEGIGELSGGGSTSRLLVGELLGDPNAPPPISFWYNGVPSAKFLATWLPWSTNWTSAAVEKGTGVSHRRSGWNDPTTGLHVIVTETRYAAYPSAREWAVAFRQTGSNASQRICNVSGLRVELAAPLAASGLSGSAGTGVVHRFRGSMADATDFAPLVHPLNSGERTAFGPFMGRSSDHTLPLLAVAAGSGGVVASVGWSGSWQVDIDRMSGTGATTLDIWHGSGNSFGAGDGPGSLPSIPQNSSSYHDVTFCSQLNPGESVRLMRVLAVAFEGTDPQVGFNTHRQLLQQHKVPRDPRTGELLGALVTSDADGLTFPELMPPGRMGPEKNQSWDCPSCAPRQLNVHVPGLKAIGAEALWLDA